MCFKELFAIVIITTARPASSAVLLPSHGNTTITAGNFNGTNSSNGTANLLNGILELFDWNDAQHSNLKQLAKLQTNTEILQFEESLAFLFRKCIATNWQTKPALQVIAAAANDITVHEILYEVLWQELSGDENKTSPFIYLELYEDVANVLANNTSARLAKLQGEIQTELEKVSAAVLQSFFIQKTTVGQLLLQLKNSKSLYHATVPRIFESLNKIEDQWQIAKGLLEFDAYTEEAVFNHVAFLKHLKYHHEVIPYELYNNLELLVARQNFVNISLGERQAAAPLLPLSMGKLFVSNLICIRNATTNLYLYECPQTYLLCTNVIANNINPVNRKKAVFEIERIGNDQYVLRSPYWSRYLHLQSSNLKNMSSAVNADSLSNTTASQITKNLYSSPEISSWFIRFRGDFATIQDSTGDFYICGGSPTYWSKMEKHAYSRQSMSSHELQVECSWLFEDCSDVLA